MEWQYKLYCMIIKKKQKIRICMVNQNVYWYKEAYIHYAWKYQYQTISNLAWEEKQNRYLFMPLQKQILCKIIYFFQSKGRNIFLLTHKESTYTLSECFVVPQNL